MDDMEWETDDDDEEEEEVIPAEGSAAAVFGNCGVISVLFETPSGFAIFSYDAVQLTEPDAWKHIWADFAGARINASVWLKAFQTFEDKARAINARTVSPELTAMIRKYVVNGQTLAVGKEDYKNVIQDRLGIPCVYGTTPVKELMWGLMIQMRHLVPDEENSELATNEDRFPVSEGMGFLLNLHKFEFDPNMMVTKRIVEIASVVYECDRCVNKYDNILRFAADYLLKISRIDTRDWDLLKIATAFKMVCYPEEEIPAASGLFGKHQLSRLMKDAPRYKDKIVKTTCLETYKEMYSARKTRLKAARVLVRLLGQAKTAYEAEQAGNAASGHEIGPGRKVCHGINPVMMDELAEWHTTLSAKRKERQVAPTLAPVDALERYTHISSHPLTMMNTPGILSMDIHPSKDIVAAGGIDTNVVLFDRPSGQILCTLTGHSKKITSLKFVNRYELFITGSADQTVRIWRGGKDENYSCIHTVKDHTAEVEAVTVHASQQYFLTASRDNSWRFYDISTGSCLTRVGEASGQEGYTSAAFHPDGLILATGTTDAVVKVWDVKTQSKVTNIAGHVGPVTAMSFSENGYLLATAALDGIKLWDLRTYRNFRTMSPYNSDTPTNAVEFDCSGSYLAIGGSDIRVYRVASDFVDWNVIKTLPDLSGTGKVTSMKFGVDANYIAVGSMDQNLRVFGLQSYQPATQDK